MFDYLKLKIYYLGIPLKHTKKIKVNEGWWNDKLEWSQQFIGEFFRFEKQISL